MGEGRGDHPFALLLHFLWLVSDDRERERETRSKKPGICLVYTYNKIPC